MTHKDAGKVTRIDTASLKVKGVIDTGFITNHLAFAKTTAGTRAYVTIGGENVVKVYTTDAIPTLVATIPTGALPHGIRTSDNGTRLYVGLENGDAVDVIDSASNKVIARVPAGHAPQALVYVSNAVPHGDGMTNLVARANSEPINIALKPAAGEATGVIVARNLGVWTRWKSRCSSSSPRPFIACTSLAKLHLWPVSRPIRWAWPTALRSRQCAT